MDSYRDSSSSEEEDERTCDVCKRYYRAFSWYDGPQLEWHEFVAREDLPVVGFRFGRWNDFPLSKWPVEEFREFVSKVKEGKDATVHLTGAKLTEWYTDRSYPIIHKNRKIIYPFFDYGRVDELLTETVCECLIERLERVVRDIDDVINK